MHIAAAAANIVVCRWIKPNPGFVEQLKVCPTTPRARLPTTNHTLLMDAGIGVTPRCCLGNHGLPAVPTAVRSGGASLWCVFFTRALYACRPLSSWHESNDPRFVVIDCDSCDLPMVRGASAGTHLHTILRTLGVRRVLVAGRVAKAWHGTNRRCHAHGNDRGPHTRCEWKLGSKQVVH